MFLLDKAQIMQDSRQCIAAVNRSMVQAGLQWKALQDASLKGAEDNHRCKLRFYASLWNRASPHQHWLRSLLTSAEVGIGIMSRIFNDPTKWRKEVHIIFDILADLNLSPQHHEIPSTHIHALLNPRRNWPLAAMKESHKRLSPSRERYHCMGFNPF